MLQRKVFFLVFSKALLNITCVFMHSTVMCQVLVSTAVNGECKVGRKRNRKSRVKMNACVSSAERGIILSYYQGLMAELSTAPEQNCHWILPRGPLSSSSLHSPQSGHNSLLLHRDRLPATCPSVGKFTGENILH